MYENLARPEVPDYEPYEVTREQAEFLLRFYELDPRTGRRLIHRAVLSRPRGWGKSPFLAAIAIAEALADVVPDGWDANGQPVGRPWSSVLTPLVHVAAVSETQTSNTWTPLLELLEGPVLDNYPGLEAFGTVVNLPRGRIEPITSSPRSVKGARSIFAVLDQTEEWVPSNGGVDLAEKMRINASKRGGATIESPNAFHPGEGSVAENSAQWWSLILEGKARDRSLLYDHREAPPETDMEDEQSLFEGLAISYGDSADLPDGCRIHTPPCDRPGWVDLRHQMSTIWAPDTDPQTSRADFLNQITHASDSWLTQPQWKAVADLEKVVADGDMVTLGFDGSRGRKRGVADSTALIGCRVSDGHLFEIAVWEQPQGDAGKGWVPPAAEVDAAVRSCFARWRVVGFYADPARWESWIAGWEAEFGPRLGVGRREHPIEWWMTGGRAQQVERALEKFHSAVVERELTHDGSYVLTRHVLNARRRVRSNRLMIAKEHPDSIRKIDAAVAAVLAYTAYLDAVAKGLNLPDTRYVPKRIR